MRAIPPRRWPFSRHPEVSDLVARVRELLPDIRRDLEALVRIESVWSDPARRDEVHRSADAVAALLRDAGVLGGPARRQMPRGEGTLVGGVAPLTRGKRLGEYRAGLVDLLGELGDGHQINSHAHYRHVANLS